MTLAGLGLNLTMGYAGQASLGTGAFMAAGAYATYNLLLRVPELPLPVSLVLGGLIAGMVGLVVGLPSLRIKGFYLVATTLAAQFLIEWVLNQYPWFSNYASSSTISAPRLAIAGYDLSRPGGRYLLTLGTVVLVTAVAWRLVRSQTGRIWMAVRDMDTAAAVIGIPVVQAKLKAFFVGATVCGIAGALWAFAYLGTVDARSFDLDRSFPGDVSSSSSAGWAASPARSSARPSSSCCRSSSATWPGSRSEAPSMAANCRTSSTSSSAA